MIKEAYVSVEVAKLLKEKGFDTPVNYEYHYILKVPQFHRKKHNFNGIEYRNCSSEWYSAPTQQMTMRWLREIYNIDIIIFHEKLPNDCYWARIECHPFTEFQQEPEYKTYEDAVEAALKYCLEKLI
jgi:hypothetical protein